MNRNLLKMPSNKVIVVNSGAIRGEMMQAVGSLYPGTRSLQALAYAGAGLIGTSVHWATLMALLQSGLSHLVVASTIGAVIGGLINYVLAHRRVFKSRVPHQVALPKFTVVALIGICVNAAVLMISAPSIGAVGAQIVASMIVLLGGFSLNRGWSFRD